VPQDQGKESDDEAEEEDYEDMTGPTVTRSGREVRRPSRFAVVTKVVRSRWNEKSTSDAIKAELTQMFVDLKALQPVKKESTRGAQVLNLHMFLVEKYLANGEYDKTKGRMVADGRDQDPAMFLNKSSPTKR